jgi:hypothetical protein
MTIAAFKDMSVTPFPSSIRRPAIFADFERLVAFVTTVGFICELWVDGSFLTDKSEPNDLDVAVAFWAVDAAMADPNILNDFENRLNGGRKFSINLDTYLCPRFDKSDPRHGADGSLYWSGLWGKGRDDWLKGYVVITTGETDVQRRILAR